MTENNAKAAGCLSLLKRELDGDTKMMPLTKEELLCVFLFVR